MIAGREVADRGDQRGLPADRLTVDSHDDVADLDAGGLSARTGDDLGNEGPAATIGATFQLHAEVPGSARLAVDRLGA